jgi:hypothetical protein
MDWWLGPSIIVVISAGVIVGLLVSFIILRAQKRRRPYSIQPKILTFNGVTADSFNKVEEPVRSFGVDREGEDPFAFKIPPTEPASDQLEVYLSQHKAALPQNDLLINRTSDALLELETNLSIARRPMNGHLTNFQTKVWSTCRSEFNLADPVLLGELSEAYVDMLLANNIVWLVMELGRDSQDLNASYTKLSAKIAERLQRIMPSAKASL